jgi:hypothetical protein
MENKWNFNDYVYLFDPFEGDEDDEKLTEFVERFDRNVFWAN